MLPMGILVFIAVPSLSLLYALDELSNGSALIIQVVGRQWYWVYEYPSFAAQLLEVEPLETEAELRDPLNREYPRLGLRLLDSSPLLLPLALELEFLTASEDVIHGFALPSAGIKMDAVPGRLNQVFSTMLRPGILYGQCSELCGSGHGFMPITAQVMVAALFQLNMLEKAELLQDYLVSWFQPALVKQETMVYAALMLVADTLRDMGFLANPEGRVLGLVDADLPRTLAYVWSTEMNGFIQGTTTFSEEQMGPARLISFREPTSQNELLIYTLRLSGVGCSDQICHIPQLFLREALDGTGFWLEYQSFPGKSALTNPPMLRVEWLQPINDTSLLSALLQLLEWDNNRTCNINMLRTLAERAQWRLEQGLPVRNLDNLSADSLKQVLDEASTVKRTVLAQPSLVEAAEVVAYTWAEVQQVCLSGITAAPESMGSAELLRHTLLDSVLHLRYADRPLPLLYLRRALDGASFWLEYQPSLSAEAAEGTPAHPLLRLQWPQPVTLEALTEALLQLMDLDSYGSGVHGKELRTEVQFLKDVVSGHLDLQSKTKLCYSTY